MAPARLRSAAVLLAAGAVLLGFALRVWQLGALPFGFHPDEGHNALDALAIADGWRPVFLPGNNGREPLLMYVMALLLAMAGPSIWAARLASAVAGTVFVAAQWTFSRGLGDRRPAPIGFAAAMLAATTFWPIAQSRVALRASLLPVWVALALWAWWRAVAPGRGSDRARLLYAAASGGLVAAAAYTHMVGRLLPLVLALSAGWCVVRTGDRAALRALAVSILTALVLLAPQLAYFARNPEMLSYRAGQVSVFGPDGSDTGAAEKLASNALHLASWPVLRGDRSWYHNVSRRPVFDPLVAPFFVAGLLVAVRDLVGRKGLRRQGAAMLALSALVVLALPSLLSVGAPNYTRLTGTWPSLLHLAGLGLATAVAFVQRRWGPAPAALGMALVLMVSTLVSARDYFSDYVRRDEVAAAFNADAVLRAQVLASMVDARQETVFVSPGVWRQSVIRFVNAADPPQSIDTADGLVLPASGPVAYAFEPAEGDTTRRLAEREPWLTPEVVADARGRPALTVLRAGEDAWREELRSRTRPSAAEAVFGDAIALEGVAIDTNLGPTVPSGTMTVTLAWRALSPVTPDHNRFVHLVSTGGRSVGQADGPPLGGSHPTTRWLPGQTVLDTVAVPFEPRPDDTGVDVLVGWYDWRTGARLPLPGSDDGSATVESWGFAAVP